MITRFGELLLFALTLCLLHKSGPSQTQLSANIWPEVALDHGPRVSVKRRPLFVWPTEAVEVSRAVRADAASSCSNWSRSIGLPIIRNKVKYLMEGKAKERGKQRSGGHTGLVWRLKRMELLSLMLASVHTIRQSIAR